MIKTGQIINTVTGEGIPYASVELTDAAGSYMGYGVTADGKGFFTMDAPFGPGTFLRVTSAGGYSPVSLKYPDYLGEDVYFMTPAAVTLDPVVVTAPAGGSPRVNPWYIAGAAGLLLFLLLKKR